MRTMMLQTHERVRDIATMNTKYEWSNESFN